MPNEACGRLATWQLKRVSTYIEANIASNIRVPDLAQLAGFSTAYFSKAFRRSSGEPPARYLARRRILRAQELLRSPLIPLCEVALACGMSDQSHFSRVFLRMVGMSPGVWRRMFADDIESVFAMTRHGNRIFPFPTGAREH
jgi:AraC-like DNA-binding protein